MTVWDRPEPRPRAAPVPLSRDVIVRAALTLADADGLGAVSLRGVAAALDAGPMRLYRYVEGRDELHDLLIDAVHAEIELPGSRAGWRSAQRQLAGELRAAALRHPWFAALLGGRPHVGPHALSALEASLAAMDRAPGLDDFDTVLEAHATIQAYVTGAIRRELSAADRDAWRLARGPHIERMLAAGTLPYVARLVRGAADPDPELRFRSGLETVLDGIAHRRTDQPVRSRRS
jgi:AcrR family transcriptional regulator